MSAGEAVSLYFGSLTRKGLLSDCVRPAETREGQSQERAEGAKQKDSRIQKRPPTCLQCKSKRPKYLA